MLILVGIEEADVEEDISLAFAKKSLTARILFPDENQSHE